MRSQGKERAQTTQFSLQQRFLGTPSDQYDSQGLNKSQRSGYCMKGGELTTPKNGEIEAKYFSSRDSGKLPEPNLPKPKRLLPMQTLKTQIKAELQKMNYRQKLINIEGLIKTSKQLCKTYGYFYVTLAMVLFYPEEPLKLSIWIHPDARSQRPLHLITKATQCQCQLEFISSLRSLLKEIFPTINFGKGKTFISLERHIADLLRCLVSKTKKSYLQSSVADQSSRAIQTFDTRRLATSSKTIPKFYHFNIEQDEQKQELFKHKAYQKQTKSTLLESIRSKDSIKDKLKNFTMTNYGSDSPSMKRERKTSRQVNRKVNNEPTLSGKIHYKLSELMEEPEEIKTPSQKDSLTIYKQNLQIQENQQSQSQQQQQQTQKPKQKPEQKAPYQQFQKNLLFQEFDALVQGKATKNHVEIHEHTQEQHKELQKTYNINSRLPQRILTDQEKRQMKISLMKRSRLGKHMTTSVEIQSQLNNLFGSEDFLMDDFYGKLPEGKALRNSVLSRVAEQFEDLLF